MTDGVIFNHLKVYKDENGKYDMNEELHTKFDTA
jgi:hypothetical protein